MPDETVESRQSLLVHPVHEQTPEFVKACSAAVGAIVLHQNAFAADYQDEKYMLLDMAIKCAGLSGKEVHVVSSHDGPHSLTR